MPIIEFQSVFAGQGVKPRFTHLLSSDTLSQVTAAGYLNPYVKSQGLTVLPSDFVFVSASDGHQIYKPVFSGATITLTVLP